MSESEFQDKVVWITGASSGIGEALCYRFLKSGARVIASSNEEQELERVRDNCGGRKDRITTLPLDLLEVDTLGDRAQRVLEEFGRVDILINNGGITIRSLAKDADITIDKKVMDIDYMGHVALTKAVLPSMIQRKSGYIVVTSSIMGLVSVPLRTSYCAAKHALMGFYEALRAEVHKDKIKVLLVCPAGVQTGISKNALTSDGSKYGKMDPVIGSGITPDECARQIMSAIARGGEFIMPGKFSQKYFVYIHRHFPGLFSFLIKRRQKFT